MLTKTKKQIASALFCNDESELELRFQAREWRELLERLNAPTLSELAKEVLDWSTKNFPDATPESITAHLRTEALELAATPNDASEMADILMLLFHVAHKCDVDLVAATRRKLAVNKMRTWGAKNAEGFVEHVREDDPLTEMPR